MLERYDSLIAFLGALPVLLVFILLTRKRINAIGLLVIPFIIYTASIGFGVLSKSILGVANLLSAEIAGLFAPIVISLAFLFWVFIVKPNNFLMKKPNNIQNMKDVLSTLNP